MVQLKLFRFKLFGLYPINGLVCSQEHEIELNLNRPDTQIYYKMKIQN